jgi:hypothetical protein
MEASDYLTEQVQRFAVSGERQFMEAYFSEAFESKRREQAIAQIGVDANATAAREELQKAMDESVHLMDQEYYAMRLTVDACGYELSAFPAEIRAVELSAADRDAPGEVQRETARMMVFDDIYRGKKEAISGSIREFWRRWHMSLSGWFREYVYVPLGGNRKGKARAIMNRWIVFLLTGLWHGASLTFLFWGIYHGFFLTMEQLATRRERQPGRLMRLLGHMYAVLVITVGFVIFRAETMGQAIGWIGRMFGTGGITLGDRSLALTQLTPLYLLTFLLAIPGSTPLIKRFGKRIPENVISDVLCLACLILCMLRLAGGGYNPFIYFRF